MAIKAEVRNVKRSRQSPKALGARSKAAIAVIALIFFLRFVPSFSPFLLAKGAFDLSVPFRYISIGWVDWAAVQLQEMSEQTVPDEELLAVLGLAHESLGDYDEALAAYERIALSYADDPLAVSRAKALAANVYLRQGHLETARERFLESNRLNPDQAFVTFNLGILAESDGDLSAALEWFERSMQASPQWVDPAVRAGAVYNRLGDPVAAVTLLRPHEAGASRLVDLHLQISTAYAALAQASARGELDEQQLGALASVGIVGDDITVVLSDLALHALDRTRQLDPQHRGLADLERLIDRLPIR